VEIKANNIGVGVFVVVIIILAVAIGIVVSKKHSTSSSTSSSTSTTTSGTTPKPSNSNLDGIDPDTIPSWAKGGYLDPFSWFDTEDFNVTFTNATVGGLYTMGLNSTWDDSVRANSNVPPLNQAFSYGSMPIRGINVGGWLSLEPFITPSFFTKAGIIDEWTLSTSLGSSAASTLEPHYSTFITKQDFAAIRAAGFDHVRIPFSYWAVITYSGDPYVKMISWRYLLRGIEWARQNGLRVNLDLHGAPGSQNGWNHSGRQGEIRWLNGTDGDLNAQRTIDLHDQLSQFFSQPRYKNIITLYGLVNEPRMVFLDTSAVLEWTGKAVDTIRGNNMSSILVFGDGFLGLDNWKGRLQGYENLLLDVHQYVIFNNGQLSLNHSAKLNFACSGWTSQMVRSQSKNTGWGPTICGEWSQADTDCAKYVNNVNIGSRWEGTLNEPDPSQSVLSPQCPGGQKCECGDANADPSQYTEAYKQWLLYFALAQMDSFEAGWGWFYWTWVTESATQWSYKLGLAAGILPTNVADRSAFTCDSTIPDFAALGLSESY
jgi:glucan 1,3-beta-glucosidase